MFGNKYASDVKLGEKYRDEQTGIEGVAVAVSFFQYGCERVDLEMMVAGKIENYGFDAPRLTHIDSSKRLETPRVGGPDKTVANRRPGSVTR